MRVYIPNGRSSYYVRFKFRGQAVFESLKTSNKKQAQQAAQNIFDTAHDRYYAGYRDGRTTTLAQIEAAYLAAPIGVSDEAKRANLNYILRMAAPDLPHDQALAMPVSVLNDGSVQVYQQSQLDRSRRPKSINSDLRQGRSVFSKRARAHYKALKIAMPITLRDFLDAPMLPDHDEGGYEPIDRGTIVRMDAAIGRLKAEDFEMWKIISLIRRIGMRSKEILNAKGSWLEARGEHTVINLRNRRGRTDQPDFKTKNKLEGLIILDQEMIEAFAEVRPDEYLIAQGEKPTTRTNLIYRKANKWMRKFVPDRSKCLYELRKEAGSVVAEEHGLDAARQLLRHKDRSTTEKYYAAALNPIAGVTIAPTS